MSSSRGRAVEGLPLAFIECRISALALEKIRRRPDWDAGMETGCFTVKFQRERRNKQISDRLCRGNGIIQIENGKRQKVCPWSCLPSCFLSVSASRCPSLSFSIAVSVLTTHTHTHGPLPMLLGAIIIFCEFPMWKCATEPTWNAVSN